MGYLVGLTPSVGMTRLTDCHSELVSESHPFVIHLSAMPTAGEPAGRDRSVSDEGIPFFYFFALPKKVTKNARLTMLVHP